MMSIDPYNLFKPIRNKLGEHDIISLVINASKKLHEVESKHPSDFRGWLPWHILLLIKWSYEYGGLKHPPKPAHELTLVRLMNLIKVYEEECQSFSLASGEPSSVIKFFRILAFQQFWLQGGFGSWHLARSYVLFCSLPKTHPIQKNFVSQMSISMNEFLELGFLLWAWLQKSPKNVKFDPNTLFDLSKHDPKTIEAFTNGISLPIGDVKIYLSKRPHAIKNIALQLNEMTPFVRYPLLKLGKEYIVYSRRVYEITLGNMFYDIMKECGGSPLSEQFASEIEKYVQTALLDLRLKFYTEDELKEKLKGEKVTDFLLPFDDCSVLLEIKSFEMRSSVKVYPKTQQLINELQDSVVKGTIQGITLANTLTKSMDNLLIPNRDRFFLLIVTYRELFLGPGKSAWDEFLKEAVFKELANKQLDIELIPPDHIIILSIEEFDLLMAVLNKGTITFPEILNRVVNNNSNKATTKFSFGQHIYEDLQPQLKLPYLDNPLQELWKNLTDKLR